MPLATRAARGAFAALAALSVHTACAMPRRARPEPVSAPAAVLPARAATAGALADVDYLRERRLMVPVDGVRPAQVPDSYDAPRGGGRRHNALDILAPRGTPVLAADGGRVLRIRENAAGGRTIYVVDREARFVYYYAHLDRYRDGLREGDDVAQGDVLGYVGTSGNAPEDTPHLHFQVMRYDDPKRWWEGSPLNPHGLLVREGRRAGDRPTGD